MSQPIFSWLEEDGIATCKLIYNHNIFLGTAICHPDDQDMKSEYTGYMIAQKRATIQYFQHIRDNEIIPALKALNHAFGSMKQSKNLNTQSNEFKVIQREIHQKQIELATIRQMLIDEKQSLNNYLSEKENFYKAIRKNREKAKINKKA